MRRFFALFLLFAASPAVAEDLVLTLSTREVAITSTYTGADITVFGLIERDANTIARAGGYDIVVEVRGPAGDVVVQKKDRLGPIWLTTARKRFSKVPLFSAILSARPLAEITDEATRGRLKLGLVHFLPEPAPDDQSPLAEREAAAFRDALIRLRRIDQAALILDNSVTMVRPNLFSAKIPLPATAPTGLYLVHVSVLSGGVPLKTVQAGFVVRKVGFDAFIANAARNDAALYGLVTLLMAISLGWMANAIFRRD